MQYRLLRLFLFMSAFAWAVAVAGIILPWPAVETGLRGLGAGSIPPDPMLQYWLRMTAGAFTGIGIFFLAAALSPHRFRNIVGLLGLLQCLEGILLLINGIALNLPPFPFYADTAFCLLVGAGIWRLRYEAR